MRQFRPYVNYALLILGYLIISRINTKYIDNASYGRNIDISDRDCPTDNY
jgi:hypothetical protein